jgi:hypothetical protein
MARVHSLLLTTTIVAGLGLSGLTPAGAGPNMPNMPNISAPNISPTRPDFNMRAPNALRDRDLASPRDPASLTPKKSKRDPKPYIVDSKPKKKATDTASRGKRGTGAAARTATPVPIPAARPGGQDKPSQASGQGVIPSGGPVLDHLRAYLEAIGLSEAERRGLKELFDLLQSGPLTAAAVPGGPDRTAPDLTGGVSANFPRDVEAQISRDGDRDSNAPVIKAPDGSQMAVPHYAGGGTQRRHGGGVFGWGAGGAPRNIKDPSGQASDDGWENSFPVRTHSDGSWTYGSHGRTAAGDYFDHSVTFWPDGARSGRDVYIAPNGTRNEFRFTEYADGSGYAVHLKNGVVQSDEGTDAPPTEGDKPSDSQPVAEGGGRPGGGGYEVALQLRGGRRIVCDFFGCHESAPTAGRIGDPGRNNPEGTSTFVGTSGPSTGPGAATDPCPDCGPTRTGGSPPQNLRPSDVGWTGRGGQEGGGTPVPFGPGGAGTSGSRP